MEYKLKCVRIVELVVVGSNMAAYTGQHTSNSVENRGIHPPPPKNWPHFSLNHLKCIHFELL